RGVAAARLDSSLDADAVRTLWRDLRAGVTKLLYVAPERFGSERFLQQLQSLRISLLVIDEAHCISEWGHNFRPDYLKLARFAQQLKLHPVLALTATATEAVARDICQSFEIAPQAYVNTGFHRPNLQMTARVLSPEQRLQSLIASLRERPGASVVYVTLQRTAEELATALQAEGFEAEAYHAGLGSEIRGAIQDRFMASPSGLVVATIAFGMGIDKADIRNVFHFNPPKSLENYAQEIGRAGRDGLPATVELLACPEDALTLENFVYGDTPEPAALQALVQDLLAQGETIELSVYELSSRYDIRQGVIRTLLCYLELAQVLSYTGPFYDSCKLSFRRPQAEVLARFDPQRREFLNAVLAQGKAGRIWTSLELSETARALDQPRDRILRALNYLEEQGEIELQVANLRLAYRLEQRPADLAELVAELLQRFEAAETRDIARVKQVFELAASPACLVAGLLDYFGEKLPGPCGHCDRCLDQWQPPMASPPPLLGQAERALIGRVAAEGHAALASARRLARFVCGLASPATQQGRPRLVGLPSFGALSRFQFAQVLAATEAILGQSPTTKAQ
ncbi:MAG: RecQ family ATP-dependent DNA helicase, partial [Candidatus Melainabacteria bacterium HGW-Melainabacteria-1]